MPNSDPSPAAYHLTDQRWLIWRLLRELFRRLRDDWHSLPRGSVRAWIAVLATGLLIVMAMSAATAAIGRSLQPRGMQAWDDRWLHWIATDLPLSFSDAIIFESFGNLAYMIPLVAIAAGVLIWRHRPLAGLSLVISYLAQRAIVLAGWQTWNRARPGTIADGLAAPALHSFPSGHVALTISGFGLLAWYWIRASPSIGERCLAGALFGALLVVVSLARVRLGTHWPSDLVAGAMVGFAWLGVVILALGAAERRGAR